MALKSYTDGMTGRKSGDTGGSKAVQGFEGSISRNSVFVLDNVTPEGSLAGSPYMGKIIALDLADTNPINETALNVNEGDPAKVE